MINISIIIPTYNRKSVLRHVLLSLTKQRGVIQNFEIIICDDGSDDNTFEMLEDFKKNNLPFELLYQRQERKMFRAGQARNLGIKIARGKKIIFIDQDVICEPTVLLKLISVQNNFIFTGQKKLVPLNFYKTKITDDVILHDFYKFDSQRHGCIAATLSSLGCINHKDLDKVGGFDEQFVGYGLEDSELIGRLTDTGICLKTVNAFGYHISHPKNYISKYSQNIYHYKRSHKKMENK